jgi:hypothetical protein
MLMIWISQNVPALGIVVALLAIGVPFYQFVATKKAESRKNNFKAYHKLIGELVDATTPKVDRQVAVVFELRNFKEYFPVSIRILEGLKEDWSTNPSQHARIFTEIDLTLSYMKERKCGFALKNTRN